MAFRSSGPGPDPTTRAADDLERRRRDAYIYLIEDDGHSEQELAVFGVVVEGLGHAGRWVRTAERAWVTWTDGTEAETDPCDDDPGRIVAAVRRSAPVPPAPSPPTPTPTPTPRLPPLLRRPRTKRQ